MALHRVSCVRVRNFIKTNVIERVIQLETNSINHILKYCSVFIRQHDVTLKKRYFHQLCLETSLRQGFQLESISILLFPLRLLYSHI